MHDTSHKSAILLIHCADRKGLVAAVTSFLAEHDGNILYLDQHVDAEKSIFFMRIEWDLTNFNISKDAIRSEFGRRVGKQFGMDWELYFSDQVPNMAVFVSRLPHCLYDILARWQTGEWQVNIPLIVSNHDTLQPIAKKFGVDFHQTPISADTKAEVEQHQLQLLIDYNIDFIVLARYMQILTEQFVQAYPMKIINIHHSFLPAFPGARPYHSAYERGVKIIGATSHYVIPELDAGPIIEQDVVRVSHVHSVADLVRKGRDLEKLVLARAIWYHLQRKTLVYDNRTVIFT